MGANIIHALYLEKHYVIAKRFRKNQEYIYIIDTHTVILDLQGPLRSFF